MAERKAQAHFRIAGGDALTPNPELDAVERKIAELTGTAEHLSLTIANHQRHVERLEREVEDFRRLKQQAETEFHTQEAARVARRKELQELEVDIQKCEALISTQQERLRALAETVEVAEQRSKQIVADLQADSNDKLKAIEHEFDAKKELLSAELESYRAQTQSDIKQLGEDVSQSRKRQMRALETELHDARTSAEDAVAKLLHEGRAKYEATTKAAEATALEVCRESEAAAKRLMAEANQKAAELVRVAQLEAEEVRRRTHAAEIDFLREKNDGLAELKLLMARAKEEAQSIVAAAMKEASELQYKTENDNEARIADANRRIGVARKAAEKETKDWVDLTRGELIRQLKEQEQILARRVKEHEDHVANERQRLGEEARAVLASARERAQAIIETANNERSYKLEELKALENSMFQSARQSASSITHDAEKIALNIVEDARDRVRNIDKTVESIIAQAAEEALKFKIEADAYAERIRRELPDPILWESELAKIRQEEQDRFQALIEPTVRNYLKAIDRAVSNVFDELPLKWQTNKVINDFAQAIADLQNRKNQMNLSDLIPKATTSSPGQPISQPPMKSHSLAKTA
jgi:hypothetical protein